MCGVSRVLGVYQGIGAIRLGLGLRAVCGVRLGVEETGARGVVRWQRLKARGMRACSIPLRQRVGGLRLLGLAGRGWGSALLGCGRELAGWPAGWCFFTHNYRNTNN